MQFLGFSYTLSENPTGCGVKSKWDDVTPKGGGGGKWEVKQWKQSYILGRKGQHSSIFSLEEVNRQGKELSADLQLHSEGFVLLFCFVLLFLLWDSVLSSNCW